MRRPSLCTVALVLWGGVVGCQSPANGLAPADASGTAVDGADEASCRPTAEETPVSLTTPTGVLHGTLRQPSGCGPFAIALIIAGSGATDRNGNSGSALSTDSYRKIADSLSERGVASVRYDKRGVAESALAGPREAELRFETYADDAAGWLAQLKSDARFGRVVVIGHSEGSLLGMLAVQKEPAHGFISLAGPGRAASVLLRAQLAQQLPSPLLLEADRILDQLDAGHQVDTVPVELAPLFRPSVQPYLLSWFAYDPAREIAKLAIPTLIAQGTTDLQVDVDDARSLALARPDATLLLVDQMNHTLKVAAIDQEAQRAAYTDPTLPLAAQLVDGLDAFLESISIP